MSYNAAIEEQYASGGEDMASLTVAMLDHPAFPAPQYVLMQLGGDPFDIAATVVLTDPSGAVIHAQPCAFRFIRPGADRDGPTDGNVSIDNVSGELEPLLRAASGSAEAVSVEFWQYVVEAPQLTTDYTTLGPPDEVIDGLVMDSVTLTEATAKGTVRYEDGRQLAVPTGPNATFDRDNYPSLFT